MAVFSLSTICTTQIKAKQHRRKIMMFSFIDWNLEWLIEAWYVSYLLYASHSLSNLPTHSIVAVALGRGGEDTSISLG